MDGHDKGPWTASPDGRTIQSEDFTHDVTLRVSGDFADDTQRQQYSERLAEKLNASVEGSDSVQEAAPCPFCGKPADLEDPDTLHPTGTGWRDDEVEGFRTYHSYLKVPKEQWCWGMHCPTPAGGCGAEISGDSKEEVLAKWNRRATAAPCAGRS